ncbi:MAG TPA: bifunctional [glutamate--ammonia ligase]-adenylyl-L-tyrosine phosphorylase/[glutamate--ammonia-ligase] adenylyltransferase [Anaeromyxobacter sp.]|nr:bifunctional [glutamate--ammonia ligase]-adenylyl-L-tyrosine phosphorylase/[glutamate--ammonia-ligase] adenylyltransferase [Anaeromyxobacter sp.]
MPARKSLLRPAALAAGGLAVAVAAIVAALWAVLPDPAPLARENPRTTALMEQRRAEARAARTPYRVRQTWVGLDRIAPALVDAVVLSEDANFFGHEGIDWSAVRDAAEADLRKGRFARGASTLTQQLAKNLWLGTEKSLWRKAKEAVLATKMERALGKKRILALYLNVVELDDGVFGVEAGARERFGTSAAALTAAQAVVLASLLPAPRRVDLARPSTWLEERSRRLLDRMQATRRISAEAHLRASAELERILAGPAPADDREEPPEEEEVETTATPTATATSTSTPTPTPTPTSTPTPPRHRPRLVTGRVPSPPRPRPSRRVRIRPRMHTHAIPGLEPAPPRAPESAERLARLARRFPDRIEAVSAAVALAPDPDLALAGIERFVDGAGAPPRERDLLEALALVAGSSRMLAALLARDPALLRRAARSPLLLRPRTEASLRRLLARAARRLAPDDVEGFNRLLRHLRAREIVRIALRDLRRARVKEVTDELSSLATACLDAAIRFHDGRLRARHGPPAGLEARERGAGFCALAMGKLGSRELNFSSDVDLVYVYEKDGETSGEKPVTHFAYYAKLAELVTESIAKPTEDGFVFRVDLNLRPDGQNGPIVNSLRAAELYYQTFGRTWERNALVKARPAAGDVAVGDELLRQLDPFIWRRSLDLDVVQEIQAMKARIDARAGAEGKDDLKLGKGGIRESEFFVSALQLLHAGRDETRALRAPAVLPALDRLLFAGVVLEKDRDELADAYLFLRRAEHRVQMADGAQTHRLPPPGERLGLARSMGYATEEAFEAALARHRDHVARLFANLLGASGAAEVPLDPDLALLADPQVQRERRTEIAVRRGLVDADRVLAAIDAMARRRTPFSPLGDPAAAVALLSDALGTPDPDQAISHLSDFASALKNPEPYFRMLHEHRRVARLLLSLFGTSDFLSKRFLRHPELIDMLLREDQVLLQKGLDTFRAEIDDRLATIDPDLPTDDLLERKLGELRRYKNEEVLRIAIHDIAGTIDIASVSSQLTDLAEAAVERCLALAEEEARAKDVAPPARLCVIGMGKLGGRELGYHSDLDLIFIYPSSRGGEAAPDPPPAGPALAVPPANYERYPRLAQRFMSFLQMPLREGRLYQIDTRLRPSGNQGALVIGADAFIRYHAGVAGPGGAAGMIRSQLWERQALLRARHVAGDPALFALIRERVLVPTVYGPREDRAALAAEIRRMRERMEAELGREASRGKNPKTGHGGLVDVEFAAQFLQLLHGHDHPTIRTGSTPIALRKLREAGLLREAEHEALADGYELLRRVELRLRIVHDYAIDHLPESGPALRQLARRLGYAGPAPGERFLAEYARVTAAVRQAFEEVVR